jgi:hypothetical protein
MSDTVNHCGDVFYKCMRSEENKKLFKCSEPKYCADALESMCKSQVTQCIMRVHDSKDPIYKTPIVATVKYIMDKFGPPKF